MKTIKKLLSFGTALLLSLSSLLMFAPVITHATVQNCVWTGGGSDAKFSTAANWSSCGSAAPLAGDNLSFPALGTKQAPVNDTVLAYGTISFSGAAGTCSATPYAWYAITGTQTLSVGGNISNTMTGNCNTVNMDANVTLTANISVTGTAGITFGSTVTKTMALGANTLTTNSTGGVNLQDTLTGTSSSSIVSTNFMNLQGDGNGFQGSVVVNGGNASILPGTLVNSSGVTVNDGATLSLTMFKNTTFSTPLTLNGAAQNANTPKLSVYIYGDFTANTGDYDVNYMPKTVLGATYNGTLTLGADETIGINAYLTKLTVSGTINGSHKITRLDGDAGLLTLAGSPNNSQTANGDVASAMKKDTISADQASGVFPNPNDQTTINKGVTVTGDSAVTYNSILVVEGKIVGKLDAQEDSIVKGNGVITGPLTLSQRAKVAPGDSPGCLSTGNLTFVSGTSYDAEIGGTTACTGYDQLKVTGTVDVSNGTLNVIMYNGFKAAVGQKYTIIDNDGSDAVTGTFAGLAEGATVTSGKYSFKISYKGGDGNDVVLSVIGTPDTGFTLVSDHPGATLAITTALAGGIFLTGRRYKKVFVRK